jgi:hypothetical protein
MPAKKRKTRRSEQPRVRTATHIAVPPKGVTIVLDNGLTIYVYDSLVEPDHRVIVELETDSASELGHDEDGRPQMKVLINEAVISNDGGEESVTAEPYTHVSMVGNLSEGFRAIGPFKSFDEACGHNGSEPDWIMTLEKPKL